MANRIEKTNATRVLNQMKIPYRCTACNENLTNAVDVALAIGIDASGVFKTLVAVGKSCEPYVFLLPSTGSLDLKKAAACVGEKSISMLPVSQLHPLTGYVHGGCSPIGMRKQFRTYINRSAELLDTVCFSAGKRGHQIHMKLEDLRRVIPVIPADLTK